MKGMTIALAISSGKAVTISILMTFLLLLEKAVEMKRTSLGDSKEAHF